MSAEPKSQTYSLMPPHDRMTPEEALEWAKRRGMQSIVMLGEAADGSEVTICVRLEDGEPRCMRTNEVLYILKRAELDVMGVGE